MDLVPAGLCWIKPTPVAFPLLTSRLPYRPTSLPRNIIGRRTRHETGGEGTLVKSGSGKWRLGSKRRPLLRGSHRGDQRAPVFLSGCRLVLQD